MLSSADVGAFLQAKGISAPIHFQGDLPDMPDEVVLVDLSGGLSSTYELLFDRPSIRVTVRGKQDDPASVEALAGAVDAAFMSLGSLTIGSKHVTAIQRLGGPPALLGFEEARGGRRRLLQATYIPEIAR